MNIKDKSRPPSRNKTPNKAVNLEI